MKVCVSVSLCVFLSVCVSVCVCMRALICVCKTLISYQIWLVDAFLLI